MLTRELLENIDDAHKIIEKHTSKDVDDFGDVFYSLHSLSMLDEIMKQKQMLRHFIEYMDDNDVDELGEALSTFAPFREIASKMLDQMFDAEYKNIREGNEYRNIDDPRDAGINEFPNYTPRYEMLRPQAD